MAFQLTLTAKSLANQISIKPNLIVEIEGVDLIFGISPILESAKWDSDINWDDEITRWDGLVEKKESRDYLSFKETTKKIQQQIMIDKGGSSSVSTMNVQIINRNAEISRAFSFNEIQDIMGKKASVFLNYAEGSHPEDSIPIFRGFIDDYQDDNTSLILSISHSENLKRKSFFEQFNSSLTQPLKYKQKLIQDIFYNQRNKAKTNLSIEYIQDNTISGFAQASIGSNVITVRIKTTSPTRPTAEDVLTSIRANPDVNAEIEGGISGSPTNVQTTEPLSFLDIDTTMFIEDVSSPLIGSLDDFTTYIRVNDEIVEVVSIDSPDQLTINRGELGSFPDGHEQGDDIASIYRIQGDPFNVALKIMLSEEGNEYYESSEKIESFRYVNDSTDIVGGIVFSNQNIQEATGLVEGDLIKVQGSISNDGDYIADSFQLLEDGRSAIIVKDNSLVVETSSEPSFSFLSKYAVFPTGLGMLPNEVDVLGFEYEKNLYLPNFTDYDFRREDSIDDAKDFIDTQVFFPQGLYSIPRKARSSVKYTSPPLSIDNTPVLDIENIVEIQKLRQKRSTHKYFYNNVVFKFNKSIFDSKYKSSIVTIDNDSFNRIKVGKTPFKIESDGLVRNTATDLMISRLSSRILDRYKFAAKYFESVHVLYKTGYNLEIGDVISFGGENTKLINLETGERDFPVALYEIINKSISVESGKILLTILETGFAVDGRFAVISPSSTVRTGSTQTIIKLNKFLDIGEYSYEGEKWQNWIGAKVIVRSEDFSFCEIVDLISIPISDFNSIEVSELSQVPTTGMIIELANYDDQPQSEISEKLKIKYAFLMERQFVTSQINQTSFESGIGGLVVGQNINVHSPDYSEDSQKVEILDITGNIITVGDDLGFSPDVGYEIEALDFAIDSGDGYRYL